MTTRRRKETLRLRANEKFRNCHSEPLIKLRLIDLLLDLQIPLYDSDFLKTVLRGDHARSIRLVCPNEKETIHLLLKNRHTGLPVYAPRHMTVHSITTC